MSWEDSLEQSMAYEHLAKEAERYRLPEALWLYRVAAKTIQKCLDIIPDISVKSDQVVRVVKLSLMASELTEAKLLAQYWLDSEEPLSQASLQELHRLLMLIRSDIEVNNTSTKQFVTSSTSNPVDNPLEIATNTQADILQDVAERILALPERELQVICARALIASILLDIEHDPPQPYSPHQISEEFGVNIELQKSLGICITKKDALEFLSRLKIAPKRDSFNRRLSKKGYEKVFDREPCSIGKKPYVFTYAEILHFEDLTFRLQVPAGLENLLNQR